MVDNKLIKNILMGAAVACLVLGQFFILKGRLPAGIALCVICVMLFVIAITNTHAVIMDFFTGLLQQLVRRKPAAPAVKRKKGPAAIPAAGKEKARLQANVKFLPALREWFDRVAMNGIDVSIPKWVLFIVAAPLFAVSQLMFLKSAFTNGIILILAVVGLVIFALVYKGKSFNFNIRIESGLKVIFMLAAIALIISGWLLLLSPVIKTQISGVILTIAGCLMGFLALPKSDHITHVDYVDEEILFKKPAWVNTYYAKAAFTIVAFFLIWIGNKFINTPENNMMGIYFYVAAAALFIIALPLFDFPETRGQNRIADIVRLAAVILAMFIAYKGQVDFLKNKTSEAVNLFLIASAIFVTAMPVYKRDTEVEKEKLPIAAEVIFLIAVFAVGAFLRIYEIDLRPLGIENDEAGMINRMGKHGENLQPMGVGHFGIPFHIVRIFILFIGELNRISLKMMGVTMGLISIPVIYFMIRKMLGARAAMFGTITYVLMRWAIHYGRFGQTTMITILAEMFAFYFLFLAIKTRKKFHWFLAGLTLPLTWHAITTAFLLAFAIGAYFIVKMLTDKKYIKANFVGLLAFMLGAWIFGSMIIHNFFITSRIYFTRASEVSVFSKDPNAPSKNVGMGIVNNTRIVLQMFNHMGDSRQRNSGGYPLEPTIDFTSAIFYGIGFFYALYFSKHYMFFIMFLCFFTQALGSILTIEAPQAMRAVGTMVPAIFFISVVFDRIWQALRNVFGVKYEALYLIPLLILPAIPMARDNWKSYFGGWSGGMDELSTVAGMYSKKLGDKTRIVLYTGLYYPGHPPYKIYRWDYKVNSANRLTTSLVWLRLVEDENFAIFFHYDTWQNFDFVKNYLFPESKSEIIEHATFNKKLKPGEGHGLMIKSIVAANEDIKKKRGLSGIYSFGPGQIVQNDVPAFKKEHESKVPYNATWSGTIMIPYYGKYRIFNKAGGINYSVFVDGKKLSPDADVILAEGLHNVKITASRRAAADSLDLYMDCRRMAGRSVQSTEQVKLDGKFLYNWSNFGLHTYYYNGTLWDKNPVQFEINNIDVDANSFQGADCFAFKGFVNAPQDGKYRIFVSGGGYNRIVIDKKYYWEQLGAGEPSAKAMDFLNSKYPSAVKVNDFELKGGRHSIELYSFGGNINLRWTTPSNVVMQPIPTHLLEPDGYITPE